MLEVGEMPFPKFEILIRNRAIRVLEAELETAKENLDRVIEAGKGKPPRKHQEARRKRAEIRVVLTEEKIINATAAIRGRTRQRRL